jgi:enoyl-CoA hydratase/carnithine racemase
MDFALDQNVAVLSMNRGENRFNLEFFEAFNAALDAVEREAAANVLVVKSSDEKIWSNGIDLDWLRNAPQTHGPEAPQKFSAALNNLMKRIIAFPMVTIAAITGHAFAGGAIMSCTFDFRFMRSDRGYFCFPEVDLNIPFTPLLNAIVKKAIPMYKLEELQLSGKRATAEELALHHIINKACHIDHLMDEVMAFAKTFNKNRDTLKTMKTRLHADILNIQNENHT